MKILIILLSIFIPFQTHAATEYTEDEIAQHNTETDCWMIFEDGVYDITPYISAHDRFMDIREWCGLDMTEDFVTKAGLDRDHKESTYQLLSTYYVGNLTTEQVVNANNETEDIVEEVVVEDPQVETSNPYNFVLPILLSLVIYWTSYFIFKNKKGFNAFWNTILILTLLIPSLGFGIFMILRYEYANLWNIDFEFMYWHVELSLVMGMIAISHFIQRFKVYLKQI
jgi:cytochrome b involved in lipid metabolism